MEIIIALFSIFAITGAAWFFRRITGLTVCPICAGVAGTWLWMLIGVLSGQLSVADYQLPVAILMGGSVVGIAYQVEKRLPPNRSPLLWKVLFIPAGFTAVYGLLNFWWLFFSVIAAYLLIIVFVFWKRSPKAEAVSKGVKELEEKMKKCC